MTGHPDLGPLLDEASAPDPSTRRELLEHVAGCASCRARLAAEDPTRLFGLLALTAPPAGALERISRTAHEAAASGPRSSRARVGVAALAASLAAAALLGGVLWRSAPRLDAVAPVARHAVEPPAASATRATVELAAPSSAQVLDLSIGDTQLIMIFDEGLEL